MTPDIPGRKQVVDMAIKGVRPAEIATRTGLSINTIYCDLSAARKDGVDIPKFTTGRARGLSKGRRVTLSVPRSLEAQAILRGINTGQLAELLLARIASDNLVDAILDDGDHHEG